MVIMDWVDPTNSVCSHYNIMDAAVDYITGLTVFVQGSKDVGR